MSPLYIESDSDDQDEISVTPEEMEKEEAEGQEKLNKRFGIDRPFYTDKIEMQVRSYIKNGDLDKAEEVLMRVFPSPYVANELRKILAKKASTLRNAKDWQGVIDVLQRYQNYADKWRNLCKKMVNQEPGALLIRQIEWLQEAKEKIKLM